MPTRSGKSYAPKESKKELVATNHSEPDNVVVEILKKLKAEGNFESNVSEDCRSNDIVKGLVERYLKERDAYWKTWSRQWSIHLRLAGLCIEWYGNHKTCISVANC